MTTRILNLMAGALLILTAGCFEKDVPTGRLYVSSQPAEAVVEVNGEVIGTTPLERDVPAGKQLIAIRKQGYRTEWRSRTLAAGESTVLELGLQPVKGLVLIQSTPPGAQVSMGEVFAGVTPLALHEISLGTHQARLTLEGYDPKEIEFTVEGRIPKALNVDLASNAGILVVQSQPSGATVFVDGRNLGTTPLSAEGIARGDRDLMLQLGGYQEARRSVSVAPSDTTRVDVILDPLPGGLSVVTIPNGARVYVNGEFKGEAPVNLQELEPGAHSVRVEARGYAGQSRTVDVERGGRRVEEFQLERNSGVLQIVTRPANVKVNVDGEYLGTTRRGTDGSDVVSAPLQIDMLSQGSHTLQLVREGYTFETKRFFITKDQVTALDETLERQFIPNVLLRLGDGKDETITGVLVRKYPNGSVDLEIRKGVFRNFARSDYITMEPLEQEEEVE